MRAPRFAGRLLTPGRPHLIEPIAARSVLRVPVGGAQLDAGPESWEVDAGGYPDPREFHQLGRVALVPITGTLVRTSSLLDPFFGVTSYQAVADMVGAALADPAIDAVLLDVDSPGGEGAGCLDLAEWIAAQRGGKPIWSCIGGQACSAGYALASAADRVLIGEDGIAGSIGVVAMHADYSGALDKAGVRVEFVYAGAKKVDGNEAAPLSDRARADLQGIVDAMHGRFCGVVAANRNMRPEDVAAQEAGIYRGRAAIAAGLADGIATMEDTAMQLSRSTAPAGARLRASKPGRRARMATDDGAHMAPDCVDPENCQCAANDETPEGGHCNYADEADGPGGSTDKDPSPAAGSPHRTERAAAAPAPAPAPAAPAAAAAPAATAAPELPAEPAALAEACAAAGLPELIAPLLRAGASMQAVERRIDEAGQIMQAAQASGQPAMGKPLVTAGVSVDTAREVLMAARADAADAIPIRTARPAEKAARPDPAAAFKAFNSRKGVS